MTNDVQDDLLNMLKEMEERYGHEKTQTALQTVVLERNGKKEAVGSLRDQMVTLIHRADRGDAVLLEEARGNHKSVTSAIRAVMAKSNDTWPKSLQPYQSDVRLAQLRLSRRVWFDLHAEMRVSTEALLKKAEVRGFVAPIKRRKKRK